MVRGAPPITVLMSVYNGEAYLAEAVESILGQTFSDFIFLIIDDASTDATPDILQRYAAGDSRVAIITNECNLGLTAGLNKGISRVDTPYIARMDADDAGLPERLEKQLAFMEEHPETVALGCWVDAVDGAGAPADAAWFTHIRQYVEPVDIHKALLLGHSAIIHPSAMLRTASLQAVGGYRVCFRYAQDYDLWLRLMSAGQLAVLPKTLLRYRIHDQTISSVKLREQRIANVAALGSALIRERGEADPLQEYTVALDYNSMARIADAAGAAAWLRWLEMNSYGRTMLTDADCRAISDRILAPGWHGDGVEGRTRHIRASDAWMACLHEKVQSLKDQTSEQRQYIEALKNQVSEQRQYIEALKNQVSEQQQYIEALQNQVSEQQQYIEALQNQVFKQQQYIGALQNQVSKQQQCIAAQQNEISMMTNSKSWKITAPLRETAVALRRMKNLYVSRGRR